jgi:hypothetical protein
MVEDVLRTQLRPETRATSWRCYLLAPARSSSALWSPASPWGVAFSFLISSPLVNEVALVTLLAMFGVKAAVL